MWQPTTSEDKEAVRSELQTIAASPHFCNSKRYPALLSYIVECTLAGRADELKERTLGVEVFQRQSDFDTHADTVVRYTAGEVRKRLSLYYHEREWDADSGSRIQISLPTGSYVPEFLCVDPGDDDEVVVSPGEVHSVRQSTATEAAEVWIANLLPNHTTDRAIPYPASPK